MFHDGPFGRLRPRPPERAARSGTASRPDLPRVVQQHPAVALVDEIEHGKLRALVVTGGNPITAFPEPDRIRAALARLDVLAVVDVLDGELCGLATHVLPATGQLERADLTLSSPLSVRSAVQATAPGRGRRGGAPSGLVDHRASWPGGWASTSSAAPTRPPRRRGLPRGAARAARRRCRRPLRGRARTGSRSRSSTAGCTGTMLPDGRWRIAPAELVARLAAHRHADAPLVLVPRREMGWSNSVRYGGGDVRGRAAAPRRRGRGRPGRGRRGRGAQRARGAPCDGRRSTRASAPASCRSPTATPGASPGGLTSRLVGVDPLTAMPHASGVPVTLTRLLTLGPRQPGTSTSASQPSGGGAMRQYCSGAGAASRSSRRWSARSGGICER